MSYRTGTSPSERLTCRQRNPSKAGYPNVTQNIIRYPPCCSNSTIDINCQERTKSLERRVLGLSNLIRYATTWPQLRAASKRLTMTKNSLSFLTPQNITMTGPTQLDDGNFFDPSSSRAANTVPLGSEAKR